MSSALGDLDIPTAAGESAVTTEQPAPSSASPTQEPSSAAPTSSPPQSSAQPSSQSPQSSEAPQSSSPPPSSAPPTSSAGPTSEASASQSSAPSSQPSSQVDQSSAASTSQAQSSAIATSAPSNAPSSAASSAPAASVTDLTSAIGTTTTTDASGRVVTTVPSQVTRISTSTDQAGQVWTVTQVIHNPTAGNDSSSAKNGSSGFFDNTGAVAGTFVVVGLAITTGLLAFIFLMLKRRRRQRLDRDVAAAAAAAAAGVHHSRSNYDDDEDEKAAGAHHGNFYAATDIHGQPEQTAAGYHDYEDPSGGYDHYATNMPQYPQGGDRSSVATAAGMAGFGAQSAQATYDQQNMYPHHEGYEDMAEHQYQPQQGGYNAISRTSVPGPNGYYFDPRDASQFTYEEENAYAYNDQIGQQPNTRHARSGSEGSIAPGAATTGSGPGLKITNA